MRLLQFFAALFILIGTFVLAGETSQACGCIPTKTEAELAPFKAKAEQGDAQAAGTVWFEYAMNGAPASPQRVRYWRRKAIRLADPRALQSMAYDWMLEAQRSRRSENKQLFANTAVMLLNRAWRNRHLLRSPRPNSDDLDWQAAYARDLRRAFGVRVVLGHGVEHWQTLANRGDATAAHHLAVYYFYGTLDQERRAYWEGKASELGDPDFAGEAVRRGSRSESIRNIRRALRPGAPVYRIPNQWVRMVTLRELNNRLDRQLKWQAEGR